MLPNWRFCSHPPNFLYCLISFLVASLQSSVSLGKYSLNILISSFSYQNHFCFYKLFGPWIMFPFSPHVLYLCFLYMVLIPKTFLGIGQRNDFAFFSVFKHFKYIPIPFIIKCFLILPSSLIWIKLQPPEGSPCVQSLSSAPSVLYFVPVIFWKHKSDVVTL